uniref:Uncharacterized protein n=1 Tax=Setaria italica TaxID=4555 RepID=K3ZPR9_SETIT
MVQDHDLWLGVDSSLCFIMFCLRVAVRTELTVKTVCVAGAYFFCCNCK